MSSDLDARVRTLVCAIEDVVGDSHGRTVIKALLEARPKADNDEIIDIIFSGTLEEVLARAKAQGSEPKPSPNTASSSPDPSDDDSVGSDTILSDDEDYFSFEAPEIKLRESGSNILLEQLTRAEMEESDRYFALKMQEESFKDQPKTFNPYVSKKKTAVDNQGYHQLSSQARSYISNNYAKRFEEARQGKVTTPSVVENPTPPPQITPLPYKATTVANPELSAFLSEQAQRSADRLKEKSSEAFGKNSMYISFNVSLMELKTVRKRINKRFHGSIEDAAESTFKPHVEPEAVVGLDLPLLQKEADFIPRCIRMQDEELLFLTELYAETLMVSSTFPRALSVLLDEHVWRIPGFGELHFHKPLRLSLSVIIPPQYPYTELTISVQSNNPEDILPAAVYEQLNEYLVAVSKAHLGDCHIYKLIQAVTEYMDEDQTIYNLAMKEFTQEQENRQDDMAGMRNLLSSNFTIFSKHSLMQLHEQEQHVMPEPEEANQLESLHRQFDPETELECPSCMCDYPADQMMTMSCAHSFCQFCYGKYIETKIADGSVIGEITCPGKGCKKRVDPTLFRVLPCDYRLYMTLVSQDFVQRHNDVKWCPGKGCDRAIQCSENKMVHCTCGTMWCMECTKDGHWPAHCYESAWFKKNDSFERVVLNNANDAESYAWISQHTRNCPKCNSPVQKTGGCNHMTCKYCGFEYCWVDNSPWQSSHYSCRGVDTTGDQGDQETDSAVIFASASFPQIYAKQFVLKSDDFVLKCRVIQRMASLLELEPCPLTYENCLTILGALELLHLARMTTLNTCMVGSYYNTYRIGGIGVIKKGISKVAVDIAGLKLALEATSKKEPFNMTMIEANAGSLKGQIKRGIIATISVVRKTHPSKDVEKLKAMVKAQNDPNSPAFE